MEHSATEIQEGSVSFFKKLFGDFYPTLCVFATRFLKDDMLAADVVQNTFIKYWDRKGNFDNYLKIKSFLYTTVRNECLNILRDNKKITRDSMEKAESQEFFINTFIEEESYRIFYNAVESLPKQCRNIIGLALEGKKNSEIAKILGIAEGTVHKQKKISYKKLRILLKDHYYLMWIFLS